MGASPGQMKDGRPDARSGGSLGVAAEPQERTNRFSGPVIGRARRRENPVRAGNARRGRRNPSCLPNVSSQVYLNSTRGRTRSQGCNDKYLPLDFTGILWHPVATICIPPGKPFNSISRGIVRGQHRGRYELRANELTLSPQLPEDERDGSFARNSRGQSPRAARSRSSRAWASW